MYTPEGLHPLLLPINNPHSPISPFVNSLFWVYKDLRNEPPPQQWDQEFPPYVLDILQTYKAIQAAPNRGDHPWILDDVVAQISELVNRNHNLHVRNLETGLTQAALDGFLTRRDRLLELEGLVSVAADLERRNFPVMTVDDAEAVRQRLLEESTHFLGRPPQETTQLQILSQESDSMTSRWLAAEALSHLKGRLGDECNPLWKGRKEINPIEWYGEQMGRFVPNSDSMYYHPRRPTLEEIILAAQRKIVLGTHRIINHRILDFSILALLEQAQQDIPLPVTA